MPNFSSIAGLEVAEKFMEGGVGGFKVSTMSNPTKLLLELLWVELSYVELRYVDNMYIIKEYFHGQPIFCILIYF